MPIVELLTGGVLIAIVTISYFIISTQQGEQGLLTPPVVATLLVANLVPAMALMVLIARRFAMRRAARSPIGGKGRLHVRLVAIFSLIAAVPTLMVVVFASLIFQVGNEFWFSPRARSMIENANALGQQAYTQERDRVQKEATTMSLDLAGYLEEYPIDSLEFMEGFGKQVLYRNLSEALIVTVTPERGVQTLALVNPYDRQLEKLVTPDRIAPLRAGAPSVVVREKNRIGAITPLAFGKDVYLYAARDHDSSMVDQLQRAEEVLKSYNSLVARARVLQLRFNAALLLVSLLITGAAVWIALRVADRLVRPVSELVDAAGRVTAGDLSARVPATTVRDEVGTLGNAFNRMTRRLEEQTGALVSANEQLDSRRMFMEAVLSGVSAGVISVDAGRSVRLTNSSAEALLKTDKDAAAGRPLDELAPELNKFLDGGEREDIIQVASAGEPRTLAVKRVRVEGGHVLTFDDITEQLLDQRRAAWSDVARRIAHEIKNPLTPIQLAAERLQRRYGKEISSDSATFEQLTGTIVRQVGDLRRMVDEFSSFARMPKPIFREESLAEIARHALFLHEVAHPDIAFSLDAPDPAPLLVCDRRQLGQALTNVVKNAVEAIQQKHDEGRLGAAETIAMTIRQGAGRVCIDVQDSGIGLPPDRGRITEPYMTTRVKGTGLGLAIVKKIVEEHFGSIAFEDAPGGGTIVRLAFDSETLARLDGAGEHDDHRDMAANG
ncbi:HAMP domain-containing protein [Sphingosinicella sp. BN140058]|nr:HAMP domain-containing protein [Sphingosinicella sp. BN140058]